MKKKHQKRIMSRSEQKRNMVTNGGTYGYILMAFHCDYGANFEIFKERPFDDEALVARWRKCPNDASP